MAHWLLACKEHNGQIFVSRLPKTIPAVGLGGHPKPGIPSAWELVGPGLRPTIQHYPAGGPNDFLLSFEYLSHLVVRRIVDIDGTWPPAVVDPVTNPPTIEFNDNGPAQDGFAFRLKSATSASALSYIFNPVVIDGSPLFFFPSTDTYSVTITLDGSFSPHFIGATPVFYRLFRRPLAGGPWTVVQDWGSTISFTDNEVGSLQFQYTAIWGYGFNPANPNDPTDHVAGPIGAGTIISYDSTSSTTPISFEVSASDAIHLPGFGTNQNGLAFGDPKIAFHVEVGDDAIRLSNGITSANITFSTDAVPSQMISGQPSIFAEPNNTEFFLGSGSTGVTKFQTNANGAKAGMF